MIHMFLPQTAEYGLRAMAQMASLGPNASVRTRDLAVQTQIPAHYLSKVMRRLVAAELLASEKGRGGGFRFARPLQRICFADVLAAVGVELEANRCAFGFGQCNPNHPCLLHPAFSELNAAFRQWATKITLQDVADGRAPVHFVTGAKP